MQEFFSTEMVIALSSAAVALAAIVISIVLVIKYKKLFRSYDFFMRGKDMQNLEETLMMTINELQEIKNQDEANKEAMRVMNRNIRSSFQKTGIVHYDAFQGIGGKMSFTLAVLDYTNSGMVLNCMHTREGCFIYVKQVDAGTTDTPLGAEEKEALERALGYIKE